MKSKALKIFQLFSFSFSFFLFVQLFELFLHPDVSGFTELWALQAMFSGFVFDMMMFTPLFLVSGLLHIFFRAWPFYQKQKFIVHAFGHIVFLLCIQAVMIDLVYYKAGVFYWMSVISLAFVFLLLARFKKLRWAVALSGLVCFIALIGLEWGQKHESRFKDEAKGPNVIVILGDTLRRDHTSFNGYDRSTTPFLNSIANESVVFKNMLSNSSWTKPAMAGLFTSQYMINNPVLVRALPIEWDGIRLGEYFYKQGYDTAFFSANPNTGTYYRGATGFEYVMQPKPASHFPIYNFVLPRFLKYYSNLPKRIQFENVRRRLMWFQKELKLNSLLELKSFMDGTLESKLENKDQYQKQLKGLWSQYKDLKKAVDLPSGWKKSFLSPAAEWIYQNALEFSFIWLQGSKGEVVVDHWLADYELVDRFDSWLSDKASSKRPFFAHFQFMSPHSPYQEQPPYLLPVFDKDSGLDVELPPAKHLLPSQGAPALKPAEFKSLMANYDDAIRVTDAQVKRLFQMLESRSLLDNTIVVFLSDHGESFYEHKIYDHMYSLYAELVNLPLLVYWKGHLEPAVSELPASIVDIYPSLVRLAGLDESQMPKIEGLSLFDNDKRVRGEGDDLRLRFGSVLLGTKQKPMLWLSNLFDKPEKPGHQSLEGLHRMVVQGDHKLVHEIEGLSIFGTSSKKERLFLFNLNDPSEPLNPVSLQNDTVRTLFQKFKPLPVGVNSKYKL